MLGQEILLGFVLAIIMYLAWAMPSMVDTSLVFGVRVPVEKLDSPAITRWTAWYRRAGLALDALVAAGTVLAVLATGQAWVIEVAIVVMLVGCWSIYYVAHRAIERVKHEEQWFWEVNQRIVASTELRASRARLPRLLLGLCIAVPVVVLASTAALYHRLPTRVVIGGERSQASHEVHKSVLAVFGPALVSAAATLILVLIALAVLRARIDLDPADVEGSVARQQAIANAVAHAILLLTLGQNIAAGLTTWLLWRSMSVPGRELSLASALPTIVSLAIAIILIVRASRKQSRRQARDGARVEHRDDDRYWKAGVFYVNPQDPAVLVPRRFGVGWGLNYGHPVSIVFLMIVIVIVALAFV